MDWNYDYSISDVCVAFDEGKFARQVGAPVVSCPYDLGEAAEAWLSGWQLENHGEENV